MFSSSLEADHVRFHSYYPYVYIDRASINTLIGMNNTF